VGPGIYPNVISNVHPLFFFLVFTHLIEGITRSLSSLRPAVIQLDDIEWKSLITNDEQLRGATKLRTNSPVRA
jgi:hypothetical protein